MPQLPSLLSLPQLSLPPPTPTSARHLIQNYILRVYHNERVGKFGLLQTKLVLRYQKCAQLNLHFLRIAGILTHASTILKQYDNTTTQPHFNCNYNVVMVLLHTTTAPLTTCACNTNKPIP